MKHSTYMYGARGEKYGIWNSSKKCWQFGICEDTPMLAQARLHQMIGDDAKKWRFEAKVLPPEMRKTEKDSALTVELQRKDKELKKLNKEVARLKAELKAAVDDLESACTSLPSGGECVYCAHYPCLDEKYDECEESSQWKWRGPQKGV